MFVYVCVVTYILGTYLIKIKCPLLKNYRAFMIFYPFSIGRQVLSLSFTVLFTGAAETSEGV